MIARFPRVIPSTRKEEVALTYMNPVAIQRITVAVGSGTRQRSGPDLGRLPADA
jgi:hypothetical protein